MTLPQVDTIPQKVPRVKLTGDASVEDILADFDEVLLSLVVNTCNGRHALEMMLNRMQALEVCQANLEEAAGKESTVIERVIDALCISQLYGCL